MGDGFNILSVAVPFLLKSSMLYKRYWLIDMSGTDHKTVKCRLFCYL